MCAAQVLTALYVCSDIFMMFVEWTSHEISWLRHMVDGYVPPLHLDKILRDKEVRAKCPRYIEWNELLQVPLLITVNLSNQINFSTRRVFCSCALSLFLAQAAPSHLKLHLMLLPNPSRPKPPCCVIVLLPAFSHSLLQLMQVSV